MQTSALLCILVAWQTVQPNAAPRQTVPPSTSETADKLAKSLDSMGLPHSGVSLPDPDRSETRDALVDGIRAAHTNRDEPGESRRPTDRPKP